jgi:hypothetical protein
MVAYEFYLRNEMNEVQLVGILPERRKDPERISPESILKWGKEVLGDDVSPKDIFYVTMTVDENGGGISSQSPGS